MAEVADRGSAEVAVSTQRPAVAERKPLDLHVREVALEEPAAFGLKELEAEPGEVHSVGGYALELDVQRLRLEAHIAEVGGDPCLLWPRRALDLARGHLDFGLGEEEISNSVAISASMDQKGSIRPQSSQAARCRSRATPRTYRAALHETPEPRDHASSNLGGSPPRQTMIRPASVSS